MNGIKTTLVFLGGAVVGATTGYLVTKKILDARYDALMQEEIRKTKDFLEYGRPTIVNTEKEYATPEEAVQALLVKPYQPSDDPRPTVEEVLAEVRNVNKNVFDDEPSEDEYDVDDSAYGIPDFVYDDEVKKRSALLPYVITDEEFAEGDPRHESFSLTWYAKDEVLADDNDEIVDDVAGAVGQENLLRFGHGSNDDRIVYIRNEKRRVDFEIAKHDGSYAEVVGLEDYNRKGRG